MTRADERFGRWAPANRRNVVVKREGDDRLRGCEPVHRCDVAVSACEVVASEANAGERQRELEKFWGSEDATFLRRELGVAIGTT